MPEEFDPVVSSMLHTLSRGAQSIAMPTPGEVRARGERIKKRRGRQLQISAISAVAVVVALILVFTAGNAVGPNTHTRGHGRGTTPANHTQVSSPTSTSTTTVTTTTTPVPAVPLTSVNWAAAVMPDLDCGMPTATEARVLQVSYPTPVSGTQVAVVLATCPAGAGDPPVGMYLFASDTNADSATLSQTLIATGLRRQASGFTVQGSTMSASVSGYSSSSVPACCPDVHDTLEWNWSEGAYNVTPSGAAGLDPLVVTMVASPTAPAVGQDVTFSVTVRNTGAETLTDVTLDDLIPAETESPYSDDFSFIRSSATCQDVGATPTNCAVGQLVPNATATITFTLSRSLATAISNTVVANADSTFGEVSQSTSTDFGAVDGS